MNMYTEQAGVAMAIQKEDIARAELEKRIPGVMLVDVAKRCELVRYSGDPREHLLLDGKAIMAFHPLETELVQEGDVYKYRVSQRYETF
jgi:hypothetical protein